jgi:hypothetical protein
VICTACGVSNSSFGRSGSSLAEVRSFNQQVYDFAEEHRSCAR